MIMAIRVSEASESERPLLLRKECRIDLRRKWFYDRLLVTQGAGGIFADCPLMQILLHAFNGLGGDLLPVASHPRLPARKGDGYLCASGIHIRASHRNELVARDDFLIA